MESGSSVVIAARDKDVTVPLLRSLGFPFDVLSKAHRTRAGMFFELIQRDIKILSLMRRREIQVAIGTSASISHVAPLCGAKAVIFEEDDADYIQEFCHLAYPLATAVCTPGGVRMGKWAHKQVAYPGYHELAYLHPDHFQPDPAVRRQLGLGPNDKYALVRLIALTAHHDVGEAGLSSAQVQQLIDMLAKQHKVFISSEKPLPENMGNLRLPVPAHMIHHVIAGATCLVSDSQTMTMEAAVLGVPAFRCNTFAGRCSVIDELENKYGLAFGFRPSQFDELLQTLRQVLENEHTKDEWQGRRKKMLSEKINVADWIFDFLQSLTNGPGPRIA